MKRITCREIGRQLGLSHSAVSLALRNHPSIPEQTQKRVKALADKLGYRPDPALGALNAYRQSSKQPSYRATLAWIQQLPINEGPDPWLNTIFKGAQNRAGELGYSLEAFHVPQAEDWKRLDRILSSRRIEGLLLGCISTENQPPTFPWEDYFAVAVARQSMPPCHLVANDQFQSAALTVENLYNLGYRRIGMVMPRKLARNTEFHFLGGFTAECIKQMIPPLYFVDELQDETTFQQRSRHWIQEQKLEAVIASGPGDLLPALDEAGLRVSEDIAVAFLSRFYKYPDVASIDQNNRQIGFAAANQLIDLIRRNERGIPESPMRLLVEGIWRDAASAPQKRNH